jgi:hypothetical protein
MQRSYTISTGLTSLPSAISVTDEGPQSATSSIFAEGLDQRSPGKAHAKCRSWMQPLHFLHGFFDTGDRFQPVIVFMYKVEHLPIRSKKPLSLSEFIRVTRSFDLGRKIEDGENSRDSWASNHRFPSFYDGRGC